MKETRGRVAIERGPIVYCAEAPDLNGANAMDLLVDPAKGLTTIQRSDLIGRRHGDPDRRRAASPIRTLAPVPMTLVPYYLWANRGAGR